MTALTNGLGLLSALLSLLVLAPTTALAAPRDFDQFKAWYPQFGFIFERILKENCSQERHLPLRHRGKFHDTVVRWRWGIYPIRPADGQMPAREH